jgi:glycosyltransferase involved in cell wall biosynthesis
LPARQPDGKFRLLFLGNLSFSPNTAGLMAFLHEAWSWLKAAIPEMELVVVGINPPGTLREALAELDIPLHADVPAVRPYYEMCDVMIAPILFGSGTRSKILEAMAYGRAVVSTEVGAAGLGLRDGEEAMLARDMKDFGEALVRLAQDDALRLSMAERAHAFQRRHYGPNVIAEGMRRLLSAPQPPFDRMDPADLAQHEIN